MYKNSLLNTFSELNNIKANKTIPVEMMNINELLSKFEPSCHYALLVDIEGLDFRVVSNIDFEKFRPTLIMVETFAGFGGLKFENFENGNPYSRKIICHLLSNNYKLVSQTPLNSIFTDKEIWDTRFPEMTTYGNEM